MVENGQLIERRYQKAEMERKVSFFSIVNFFKTSRCSKGEDGASRSREQELCNNTKKMVVASEMKRAKE